MKKNAPKVKQPTPQELTDSCLGLLRSKFYAGDDKGFFQERRDLLREVVLYPAAWLDNRGITIHGDDYRRIFHEVFIQAAAHVTSKIKYRPAYLRQVIQSHLRLHGEKYYDDAKATRNTVEHALNLLGQIKPVEADPVRQLSTARDILAVRKPKKAAAKPPIKTQLNLFQ